MRFRGEYNFKKDLEENEQFEGRVATWLIKRFMYKPEQVILTEGYFPDYDIITPHGYYEVKRDYWNLTTHNILIETIYNVEQDKPGWFYHTKADFIAYVVSEDKFFWVALNKLREHYAQYPNLWVEKRIQQPEGFTTQNFVCKLQYFDEGIIQWEKFPKKVHSNKKAS
jgi:hypothetical protein